MSRVGFHKHGRDTTKRLTKYNAFSRILNFGGCVININTFQSTVMRLVRVLCQLKYVSLSTVGYLNMSESRNFNNEIVCE